VPSFRGALAVGLVIEGTIIVMVPLITLFLLNTLMLLGPVVNQVACISSTDDVAQILVILIPPSGTFLQWSETAGRVPTQTLLVVKLMTTYFIVAVEDRVNDGCYV
jgi:hypothetical protein